jgi:hypothetical protein
MKVVEPASYQRETQLLPGSKERQEIEVASLEELKRELNESRRKDARKQRLINRGIVAGSVALAITLLLNNSSDTSPKDSKKKFSIKKAFKIFGYALSIIGFIKGTAGINLKVIEPKEELPAEKKFSDNLSKEDHLRKLSAKAVIDVLLAHNLIDKATLKNRSTALRYRAPKGANRFLIDQIVEYGRKL